MEPGDDRDQPSTAAGTTSGTLFNHYALLGTAEQLLGLPKLG